METLAVALIVAFTAVPYALGITLAVFHNSPIPLLGAMLAQRIGFVIFLALVLRDAMDTSTLSGLVMLCCFLVAAGSSSLVLQPMMRIIMAHLAKLRASQQNRPD